MSEKFAPGVVVDGHYLEPEGWMWVLAFALRGVPWAVEKASEPGYDLRRKMRDYERRKQQHFLEEDIVYLEDRLRKARMEHKKLS